MYTTGNGQSEFEKRRTFLLPSSVKDNSIVEVRSIVLLVGSASKAAWEKLKRRTPDLILSITSLPTIPTQSQYATQYNPSAQAGNENTNFGKQELSF
jgi:hypothetical protein